jgi:hypothetical protein
MDKDEPESEPAPEPESDEEVAAGVSTAGPQARVTKSPRGQRFAAPYSESTVSRRANTLRYMSSQVMGVMPDKDKERTS